MPQYILAYHGGKKPESPEAGAREMERWKAWVAELGDAIINPGTPLGKSTMVSAEGVKEGSGPDALTGFSMITADNLEAALEITQRCPFLEQGTIEVAEVFQM